MREVCYSFHVFFPSFRVRTTLNVTDDTKNAFHPQSFLIHTFPSLALRMYFWSRFRQNSFQIFLLLWGSILHFLLTGVYTYLYVAGGDFPVHYAVAPFLQILNFLGLHFLFSWVYRTLPWKKVGKMLLFAELFWVVIPIVLETVLLYLYHIPTNSSFLAVILASPFRESQEYMSALPTTIYGILVLLLGITAALSYWGTRFLSSHRKFWQKKNALRLAQIGIVLCLLTSFACFARNAINYKQNVFDNSVRSSNSADRLFWSILRAMKERTLINQHIATMTDAAHFTPFIVQPSIQEPLKVVVILGESARADFMGAYGYPRNTTPALDSLINRKEVIAYNDAVSSAPSTYLSGQRIFTFWDSKPGKEWYDFPDLTTTFKRANFKTKWISNQDFSDYSSIERVFTTSADTFISTAAFMNNLTESSIDERLIPHVLSDTISAPSLTVIHLMGSHHTYHLRYPPAFDFFKAKDMEECSTEDAKSQKAAYLNSLRYTDHLLEKMIKHYSSQRALVFYFSDHGEMVDEPEERGFFGHGVRLNSPSLDIPFFVYASPQLRKDHPELWERIKKAQFRPISTAWFTNSLTSLLGIHTKYNDERYNFFSDKFANPTRIAVQGDERHTVPPLKRKRVK